MWQTVRKPHSVPKDDSSVFPSGGNGVDNAGTDTARCGPLESAPWITGVRGASRLRIAVRMW